MHVILIDSYEQSVKSKDLQILKDMDVHVHVGKNIVDYVIPLTFVLSICLSVNCGLLTSEAYIN